MRTGIVRHEREKSQEDLVNMYKVLIGANDGVHWQDKW